MIKDSGNRTKFESGAVRDIQEGKGRCDLLPLDIIDLWCDDGMNCTLYHVGEYLKHKGSGGPESYFGLALDHFAAEHQVKDLESGEKSKHNTMIPLTQYKWELVLEVAKHFEEGAKKYGDRNWEKGIPCDRYIDSAVRHYCKWRAGWDDEPHDRAFIWNILCCEWTRQRYGWNLERLEKKSNEPKSGLLFNWADIPDYVFKQESESKEGVKIGKQLSKGIQDGLKLVSSLNGEEAAKKVHWGCSQLTETESVSEQCGVYDDIRLNDDTEITIPIGEPVNFNGLCKLLGIDENASIKNEDILAQIDEQEKDHESADLNAALEIVEHYNICFHSTLEDCGSKNCHECKYYTDPDYFNTAVNQLAEYVKRSLNDVKKIENRYIRNVAGGVELYDDAGQFVGYVYGFTDSGVTGSKETEAIIRSIVQSSWGLLTLNPFTLEKIIEDHGYIADLHFIVEMYKDCDDIKLPKDWCVIKRIMKEK